MRLVSAMAPDQRTQAAFLRTKDFGCISLLHEIKKSPLRQLSEHRLVACQRLSSTTLAGMLLACFIFLAPGKIYLLEYILSAG